VESPSFKPFAHLATPNVALDRLIIGEFVAAKRRFVVHLRGEDLQEALAQRVASAKPAQGACDPVSEDALAEALGRLVEWGNLRRRASVSREPIQVLLPTPRKPNRKKLDSGKR
jgi:hypothetical protein